MSAVAIAEQPQITRSVTKVVIEKPGSYDRMEVKTSELPAPGEEEVRIVVKASGVNYADVMVRMGLYASAKEFVGWPITPGFEVAGVIDAVGDNVTTFAVGDEVIATTLFGGYASHVVVAEPYITRKPAGLDFAQAAALPVAFLTAYYALFELAHPRKGHKVLVHSAAGGVGSSLVQLAKLAGCEVTGVVGSSHKVDTAREYGAHHVIDKATQDLWSEAERIAPEGYDLILDANGVATLGDSYKHLRKAGKLVVYGFHTMIPKKGGRPNYLKLAMGWLRTPRFNPIDMTQDSKSVLAFNLSYLYDRVEILREAMAQLEIWLADGSIKAPPVRTYPLNHAGQAHADIESGLTIGKLILIPEETP